MMISTIKTFDCCAGRLTVKLSDDSDKPVTFVRHDYWDDSVQKRYRAYLKHLASAVREDPDRRSLAPAASEWAFIAEQLTAEGLL
jgi:hypothetical protein